MSKHEKNLYNHERESCTNFVLTDTLISHAKVVFSGLSTFENNLADNYHGTIVRVGLLSNTSLGMFWG